MADPTPIGPIASAISEIAKTIGIWMASADRRKMQSAIEAGEKYIQCNEGEGEFANLTDKDRPKILAYWRKRFFNLN